MICLNNLSLSKSLRSIVIHKTFCLEWERISMLHAWNQAENTHTSIFTSKMYKTRIRSYMKSKTHNSLWFFGTKETSKKMIKFYHCVHIIKKIPGKRNKIIPIQLIIIITTIGQVKVIKLFKCVRLWNLYSSKGSTANEQ